MASSYLHPGVYVEEVSGGARPIESVGTSTAAFVGFTDRRPADNLGEPVLVTSWTQYTQGFGAFSYGFYTPLAVYGFFQNGGGACYVQSMFTGDQITKAKGIELAGITLSKPSGNQASQAKATKEDSKTSTAKADQASQAKAAETASETDTANPEETAKAKADETASKTDTPHPFKVMPLTTKQLKLIITPGQPAAPPPAPAKSDPANAAGQPEAQKVPAPPPFTLELWDIGVTPQARLESFANLSLDPASDRPLLATVNGKSKFVQLQAMTDTLDFSRVSITNDPTMLNNSSPTLKPLVAKRLETPKVQNALAPIEDQPVQFDGKAEDRTGLMGLAAIDDIAIVCAPDIMYAWQQGWMDENNVISAQKALITHCENARDRVAILDAPPGKNIQSIKQWREADANFSTDGGYAALYYPWVRVDNPRGGEMLTIPPSGHIAGLYARVDTQRGVHKAPANEELRGVTALDINVSDSEQNFLNPIGVNCIRSFQGRGIRVWGARTLADSASEWKYVPVRRLFCMVEKSIQRGTQWAVFEPNDLDLWERLKRDIGAYLSNVWRNGALFGVTEPQAFFVKCDEELNPKEVRDAGQVIVQVGIAPVKPAEFVIIRIQQTS